jgi:hypothetical protein
VESSESRPSSKAWIAGPVIGAFAFIAILISILIYLRRRQARQSQPAERHVDTTQATHEKAQLHSDCVPRPDPYELEGSHPLPPAELTPEDIPQELPGREVGTQQDHKDNGDTHGEGKTKGGT